MNPLNFFDLFSSCTRSSREDEPQRNKEEEKVMKVLREHALLEPHAKSESTLKKWALIRNPESPFFAAYSNLYPVRETDVITLKAWEFSTRNFTYYGEEVKLPDELHSFFAYGNSSFEEAEIIFLGDSNHAHEELGERRYTALFQQIIREGDTLLQEGLTSEVQKKAIIGDVEFTIQGWENRALLEECKKTMELELILTERNKHLLHHIEHQLNFSKRVIVYVGEGHIIKSLLTPLCSKKFVVLYDREVMLAEADVLAKQKKDYLSSKIAFDKLLERHEVAIVSKSDDRN
ncbi:hypothetical protein PHSC3_000858 [Chlamydiales bacterium STE3]|nr:hypothetical protein PHSC3_000858 [Chlamydiales bacterium STE3]